MKKYQATDQFTLTCKGPLVGYYNKSYFYRKISFYLWPQENIGFQIILTKKFIKWNLFWYFFWTVNLCLSLLCLVFSESHNSTCSKKRSILFLISFWPDFMTNLSSNTGELTMNSLAWDSFFFVRKKKQFNVMHYKKLAPLVKTSTLQPAYFNLDSIVVELVHIAFSPTLSPQMWSSDMSEHDWQPDRTFRFVRAPKHADHRILWSSESKIVGFPCTLKLWSDWSGIGQGKNVLHQKIGLHLIFPFGINRAHRGFLRREKNISLVFWPGGKWNKK